MDPPLKFPKYLGDSNQIYVVLRTWRWVSDQNVQELSSDGGRDTAEKEQELSVKGS